MSVGRFLDATLSARVNRKEMEVKLCFDFQSALAIQNHAPLAARACAGARGFIGAAVDTKQAFFGHRHPGHGYAGRGVRGPARGAGG